MHLISTTLNTIKNGKHNQESINILKDSIISELSTLINNENKDVIKSKIEIVLNISMNELDSLNA